MNKLEQLIKWFDGKEKILVALSGGVDSALVAYASYRSLGEALGSCYCRLQNPLTGRIRISKEDLLGDRNKTHRNRIQ